MSYYDDISNGAPTYTPRPGGEERAFVFEARLVLDVTGSDEDEVYENMRRFLIEVLKDHPLPAKVRNIEIEEVTS